MALEGVRELTDQLNALGRTVAAKELRGTVRKAMEPVFEKAKATIPQWNPSESGREKWPWHFTYKGRRVHPGFASRNVRIGATVSKYTGVARAVVGVRKEAFYAVNFVELGSSKNAAKPWLRPALESSQTLVLQKISAELKRRIDRIAKKRA